MKKIFRVLSFLAFCVSITLNVNSETPSDGINVESSLKSFDAAVRESRLEMRAFCSLVQDLMKKPDTQTHQKAIDHISQAIALWESVQRNFQDDPPDEYKGELRFKQRLTEILVNMVAMKNELANSSFEKPFQTCALTCGLFVKMHEENGLTYALDRLYHMRKLTKELKTEIENQGLKAAQERLPELLHRLDQVLLSPCPAPADSSRCQSYQAALKTTAAAIYDLVITIKRGNVEETIKNIGQLISRVNEAYSLAL